jgi:hypothetical protein
MTERARSKRPSPSVVLWGSLALFAMLFVLLALRFSAEQATSPTAQRATQVRKVIKRRVVTTIVPSPGQNQVSSGPASSSSYSSAPAEPEPVVTSAS